MAKKAKEVKRTILSNAQAEAFLSAWAKRHGLKGKELEQKIRHVAATRLAALDRYVHATAKKAPHKKVTHIHKKAA